ncbi:MAG TPA: hypothetical protein VGB15_13455 [Longimicrobium sp.]|jgi:hypothetical protein
MREFEVAGEIVETLRLQFAHLMREALRNLLVLRTQPQSIPDGIRGKSLRLMLEQPDYWEYRLFAQVLIDEIAIYRDLRAEHRIGIALGQGEWIESFEAMTWIKTRTAEIRRILVMLEVLMSQHLQAALGQPGNSGDADGIVFCARRVAALYAEVLEWSQRIRRAHAPECFEPVLVETARATDDIIEQLEKYGPSVLAGIEELIATPSDGSARHIDFVLAFQLSNQDRMHEALRRAQQECF